MQGGIVQLGCEVSVVLKAFIRLFVEALHQVEFLRNLDFVKFNENRVLVGCRILKLLAGKNGKGTRVYEDIWFC